MRKSKKFLSIHYTVISNHFKTTVLRKYLLLTWISIYKRYSITKDNFIELVNNTVPNTFVNKKVGSVNCLILLHNKIYQLLLLC